MLLSKLECGQTEARETREKLKALPIDVYHELTQAQARADTHNDTHRFKYRYADRCKSNLGKTLCFRAY
jgi:hypothetical protein